MPDLMSHLAATHILRRGLEYARGGDFTGKQAAMLYVGGCLPDFISRVPAIVTGLMSRAGLVSPKAASISADIWYCFHSPVAVAVAAYLLVLLLPQEGRRGYFVLAAAASALHFAMDALQSTLGDPGTLWFFPFSWKTAHLHLFWPDKAILGLPWLALAVVILEALRARRRQRG